jgi:endonuclease YncB( thermonuclease family)
MARRGAVRPYGRGAMSKRTLTIVALLAVAAIAGASGLPGTRDDVSRPALAGATGEAVVTRVVDGDTAILSTLGRARFIGIDTPEVFGHRECFGPQASAFTKRTLSGRRVRYEIGAEPRDRYGRALVYLHLPDGRFFNEMLVAGGYAEPLEIAPNVRYAALFARRAAQARDAARGLWSRPGCAA